MKQPSVLFLLFVMASELSACVNNTSRELIVYAPDDTAPLLCFKEKVRNFSIFHVEKEIKISQNWAKYGVSAVVWEAAVELAQYMANNMAVEKKRILELGAGTGLVGIVAAKLGAYVTVTDLATALPLLKKNIHINFEDSAKNISTQELKWGENLIRFNPNNYDYVVGADIVYIEDTFNDLLQTLIHLGRRNDGKRSKIILACKLRYERELNFISMLKKHAVVNEIYNNPSTKVVIFDAEFSIN